MTDDAVERFPARLPYDKADRLLQVYAYLVAGEPDRAAAYFAAHRQDVSDAAGAIRYWRDQYAPPTIVEWSAMTADQYATSWARVAPGIVVRIAVPPGPVSFQVSGGVAQAWISDSPTFDTALTSYGMGGSGWITSPGVVYGVLRIASSSLDCRFERGAG